MIKNKNVIFIVLGIIILLGIIVGLLYHFRDRRTYTLNLPQLEEIENIYLSQNDKGISISDEEEMKDILEVLNGTKRVTKNESIQDAPVNFENKIKVDFNFIEEGTSTIYVYTKNERYYIEQPYNGIYQISGDEYNSIEKYIRAGTTKVEKKFNLVFYQKTSIKPKQKEIIIKKNEIKGVDYNVYAFEGNVAINLNSDSSELTENSISLRDALLQNKITIDEIIEKANKDLNDKTIKGDMYKDGGSMIYQYGNYTILKYNTIEGNRDMYIGTKDMTMGDLET